MDYKDRHYTLFTDLKTHFILFFSGVVALLLGADPTLTPAEVTSIIMNTATRDQIIDGKNSPNLLLYTY